MCYTVCYIEYLVENINDITMAQLSYCDWFSWTQTIGGKNREPGPLLNLRPFHRNVIFVIENYLSIAKWPSYFLLL